MLDRRHFACSELCMDYPEKTCWAFCLGYPVLATSAKVVRGINCKKPDGKGICLNGNDFSLKSS